MGRFPALSWGTVRLAPHSSVLLVNGRESENSDFLFLAYDGPTGKLLWKLNGVAGFGDATFMPDDKSFLIAMHTPKPELYSIVQIEMATGNVIRTLFEDVNYQVALSPSCQ